MSLARSERATRREIVTRQWIDMFHSWNELQALVLIVKVAWILTVPSRPWGVDWRGLNTYVASWAVSEARLAHVANELCALTFIVVVHLAEQNTTSTLSPVWNVAVSCLQFTSVLFDRSKTVRVINLRPLCLLLGSKTTTSDCKLTTELISSIDCNLRSRCSSIVHQKTSLITLGRRSRICSRCNLAVLIRCRHGLPLVLHNLEASRKHTRLAHLKIIWTLGDMHVG